jgi:beta-galactosidase/beta-glucuronidase
VDGASVGTHFGGTVSFSHDITRFVEPGGEHDLVVRVLDRLRDTNAQPSGKQCREYKSRGCHYTRTTGIWQTVWLEPVYPQGLKSLHIVPDLDGARFIVTPAYHADPRGLTLRAQLLDDKQVVSEATVPASQGAPVVLPVPDSKPWHPSDPHLYDLTLDLVNADAVTVDHVESYAGLRKVHIEGNRVFLNNEPLYLRLVLDQGFYPDGVWTAPSDDALRQDVQLSMQAGFNGARLHQKVFEERFHYWADRLGYLTWGESASWGCDVNDPAAARFFLTEWAEIVLRDRNHPSIIAWTPFNETGAMLNPKEHRRVHRDAYLLCKSLDPTRPVNDTSGYIHARTDLWTVHNYEQDPARLREQLTPDAEGGVWRNHPDKEVAYEGQPYIVDEFGGIKWIPPDHPAYAENSWGYGNAPKTLEEFYARLAGLVEVLLSVGHVGGYCYTQLTDVEQEQNGVYNYDRSAKFDMRRVSAIFSRTPEGGGRGGFGGG